MINNGDYTINTENMKYDNSSRIITIDEFVKISGKMMAFNANAMTFDINTSKVLMEGNVKGIISGRFYNI